MTVRPDQLTAWLESLPARDTSTAMILLACRRKDEALLSGTMVYFCRQFGVDYWTNLLCDEIEPLLTSKEFRWLWNTVNNGCDRPTQS